MRRDIAHHFQALFLSFFVIVGTLFEFIEGSCDLLQNLIIPKRDVPYLRFSRITV